MRSLLSVSMPVATLKRLKKKAKDKKVSVSAYIVRLLEEDEYLISEEELLEDIRQGQEDYKNGKYRSMGPNDKIEDFLPITSKRK